MYDKKYDPELRSVIGMLVLAVSAIFLVINTILWHFAITTKLAAIIISILWYLPLNVYWIFITKEALKKLLAYDSAEFVVLTIAIAAVSTTILIFAIMAILT